MAKKSGYNDEKLEDGTWYYFGQGQVGDQNPKKYPNKMLIEGEKTILLFSTREPNAYEVKRDGHYKKRYQFEGVFGVDSYEIRVPSIGERKGDKLLRFHLLPVSSMNGNQFVPSIKGINIDELRNELTYQTDIVKKGQTNKKDYWKRFNKIKQYALLRVNGVCEFCNEIAPFIDADENPYLEVHHILRLADDQI